MSFASQALNNGVCCQVLSRLKNLLNQNQKVFFFKNATTFPESFLLCVLFSVATPFPTADSGVARNMLYMRSPNFLGTG